MQFTKNKWKHTTWENHLTAKEDNKKQERIYRTNNKMAELSSYLIIQCEWSQFSNYKVYSGWMDKETRANYMLPSENPIL